MHDHFKRAVVLVAWLSAVVGWILYQRSTGLGTIGAADSFIEAVRGKWWAVALFIVVYALRPLVLFPATLMTIAGGLLFGPVVGIATTVIGANASAMVAYWMARTLGFEPDTDGAGIVSRWSARMREESFTTIMIMRMAFLPYDLVNYAAGFLRIKPWSFLLATAIGSIPGTISFTLAGASIDSLADGPAGIDPRVLAISVVLFTVSIAISRVVKRRRGRRCRRWFARRTSSVAQRLVGKKSDGRSLRIDHQVHCQESFIHFDVSSVINIFVVVLRRQLLLLLI